MGKKKLWKKENVSPIFSKGKIVSKELQTGPPHFSSWKCNGITGSERIWTDSLYISKDKEVTGRGNEGCMVGKSCCYREQYHLTSPLVAYMMG